MAMNSQPSLALISEKAFSGTTKPASSDLVAYCDAHDLVAIAADTHDVVVYRITGHPAFVIKRRNGEAEVTALKWKHDGSVLAVGWNDGSYGLYSGESGRLLSQGTVRGGGREREWTLNLAPDYGDDEDEEEGPNVTCFGWECHVPSSLRMIYDGAGKVDSLLSTEDWCEDDSLDMATGEYINNTKVDGRDAVADLTSAVATLDVTELLPRLTAIPSHGLRSGPDGNKFGTQATTDSVFAPPQKRSSNVDALFVFSSDGNVQVLQDETVKIGTARVRGSKPAMHASHGKSACHSVLSRDQDDALHASFVDLPLDTLDGPLLDVVSTNTKRIQNLLAYITQTVRCIQHDFSTGLQFPARVMANMNSELAEKQEGDVITNLYHLAMTSDFTPMMLEWLIDIVKETNHKRWDQAVNAMYANIQNHLFFNLMPALNRLSVATTTLRGHARFHEGTSKFEVAPEVFTYILEGVDSLRLVGHKMQLIIMAEHRQFRAFSKWLRVMIEIGVAGPGSKGAIETEEREVPNFDYSLLLAYLKDTMTCSLLTRHVAELIDSREVSARQDAEFFAHPLIARMGYKRTKEALGRVSELKADQELVWKEVPQTPGALVNLPALAAYLAANVRVAMERITAWQSKMLTAPKSLHIDAPSTAAVLDMQMIVDQDASPNRSVTRLLVLPPETRHQLMLYSVAYSSAGAGTASTEQPTMLDFDHEILDAKFHGPRNCLLLVCNEQAQYALMDIALPAPQAQTHEDELGTRSVLHTFSPDSGYKPERLIVGGRTGKRVCLVLGNEGREWRALDLDTKAEETDDLASTDDFMDGDDGMSME
ncbi:hypothetical protein LTR36_006223 [Oleoguttula mirabilis]|uniref:Anaphase-promoting complex subunit 4 n=1 Tax=Oleoguttula mirabilis TaxID=1507867 RepID=A0AAV9JBS2_9PEZI|nr:hypothetical protein LTR36_006223 [Oleoguttula mirabilis]